MLILVALYICLIVLESCAKLPVSCCGEHVDLVCLIRRISLSLVGQFWLLSGTLEQHSSVFTLRFLSSWSCLIDLVVPYFCKSILDFIYFYSLGLCSFHLGTCQWLTVTVIILCNKYFTICLRWYFNCFVYTSVCVISWNYSLGLVYLQHHNWSNCKTLHPMYTHHFTGFNCSLSFYDITETLRNGMWTIKLV